MKIVIYTGIGVLKRPKNQAIGFAKEYFPNAEISEINYLGVRKGEWVQGADLFIMPGGDPRPAYSFLGYKGRQIIREFVKDGGRYIGFCAGAYFACKYVNFAKDSPLLKTVGEFEIALFDGTAIGPVHPNFKFNKPTGVIAAPILGAQGKTFYSYSNGGCYFKLGDSKQKVKVLANYNDHLSNEPAVILCNFGKGKALLAGIHIEYNPNTLEHYNKEQVVTAINIMQQDEALRIEFNQQAVTELMK